MKKEVYAVIIVAAVLIVYSTFMSDTRKSIFTERLGDMTLTRYDTGEAASREISEMYGLKDIPLAKGYSAVYAGKKGTMRIWVAEPPDHNVANDAYDAMNSMLGASSGHEEHEYSGDVGQTESHGGHSGEDMANGAKPVKVDFMEFAKPEVYMIKLNDVYNYYYFKMNYRMGRVYWISFDSPDTDYQVSIVKQAVMDI